MNTDEDLGVGRIRIQGDWDLNMIGEVCRAYVQLYSAGGLLFRPGEGESSPRRTEFAIAPSGVPVREVVDHYASETPGRFNYPWRGGYSAVTFFRVLYEALPPRYLPEILEIRYASPGFIEVLGFIGALSFAIRTVTKNAERLPSVYKQVQDTIRVERMNKLDVRERRAKVDLIERSCAALVETIDLPQSAIDRLQGVTPNDSWARLKLLMSMARRVERVAQFQRADLATLEEARPVQDVLSEKPTPG